ncbi:MAG: hypothetical protein LC804_27385, partial [Acidobacteria bacterium]|nr:hypothetical protein [Acidobacteriota bacterium]
MTSMNTMGWVVAALLAAGPAGAAPGGEPIYGLASAGSLTGSGSHDADQRDREREAREREAELYDDALEAIDEARWDRAIERLNEVIALHGPRADAAMYWKAHAQSKAGQRADALSTVAELIKGYPNTKWAAEARALEIQVRREAGQPVRPENQADEDLKLLAIQGLQHSDPEQAVPMLEKFLQGNHSPRLKDRALFVLAQSSSARARQVIGDIARGKSNPDLQRKAIQYLGVHGGRESRELLAEVYASSGDVSVKRRILQAFMISGERQKVLAAATSETNPELRAEAVRQLGVMGAHEELWQLYQKETSRDVKTQILQAMFVGGNAARLIELARTEQDPALRRTAVRNLGLI